MAVSSCCVGFQDVSAGLRWDWAIWAWRVGVRAGVRGLRDSSSRVSLFVLVRLRGDSPPTLPSPGPLGDARCEDRTRERASSGMEAMQKLKPNVGRALDCTATVVGSSSCALSLYRGLESAWHQVRVLLHSARDHAGHTDRGAHYRHAPKQHAINSRRYSTAHVGMAATLLGLLGAWHAKWAVFMLGRPGMLATLASLTA